MDPWHSLSLPSPYLDALIIRTGFCGYDIVYYEYNKETPNSIGDYLGVCGPLHFMNLGEPMIWEPYSTDEKNWKQRLSLPLIGPSAASLAPAPALAVAPAVAPAPALIPALALALTAPSVRVFGASQPYRLIQNGF